MFRFTIRDVMWLTVMAALCSMLWIQHRQSAARVDWLTKELEAATRAYDQALIVLEHQRRVEVRNAKTYSPRVLGRAK
jgi:hypothetical protein